MVTIREYFSEPDQGVYYYEAVVINPRTETTWGLRAVVHDNETEYKIREFEAKAKSKQQPTPGAKMTVQECAELRDLVYKMVKELSKGEREVLKQTMVLN